MQASPIDLSALPPSRVRTQVWIGVGVITALMALLYAGVIAEMARAWMHEMGASHGMLIPPLVAWLVWVDRKRILAAKVQPDNWGLLLLIPAAGLYLLGRLGAEFFLTRISLILNLTAFIWTFWGRARLAALAFHLLLLSTMIPIPQLIYKSLSAPLQLLASTIAAQLAQAASVTVYQDGNIIHLANISLGVEEACSGMHSISALMVGSLLVGFLQLGRPWLRLVLFLSSFPIAIMANVIRVTGTAILADRWEQAAMGFYHYFSGWVVFLTAFGLLWAVMKALQAVERRLA